MENPIKYNTNPETLALKKGNFWIGTGDVIKGPTDITGYWAGISPPLSGYTIYLNKVSNGPSIYVAQNDNQFINYSNRINKTSFTSVTQSINYFATQTDRMVLNRDYEEIITNGLVFNIDAGFTPSYPRINEFLGDLGGNISYNVKNVGIPLDEWYVKRSDISLITDGSIAPPYSGAQVWSSTINTSLYANTLHRTWPDGSVRGIIGNLGQGFYRYYMWVRGKSTNSSGATMSIDISDGSSPGTSGNILVGTNEQWQLFSCWDNGGSGYNVNKWFDIFLTGVNGDTYYISGISIVRSDVTDIADLKPLFTFPGYLNYSASTTSELDGILTNGPSYSTSNGGTIVFDGIDDNINNGTSLQQFFTGRTPYTVEVWSKWNPQSGYRMVASNENSIGVGRDGVCLTLFSANTSNAQVYHERFAANNQVAPNLTVPLSIVSNSPFHMVATYDGTLVKVYVNGSGSTESTSTANITNTTTSFRLGSRGSGSGNFFNGNIFITRIYNRALSQSEVVNNYRALIPRLVNANLVTQGLVFYVDAGYTGSYPTTGTTWFDIAGTSGVTGTLTNGPTFDSANGGSLVFDAINDYVTFGNQNLGLDFISKSFTAWVNLGSSLSNPTGIIDKDFDNGGSNYGGWGFWLTPTRKLWWWNAANQDIIDNGSSSIGTNVWTHVAVTYNSVTKSASFYINGVLNSTGTNTNIVEQSSSTQPLVIGAIRVGTPSQAGAINGKVANVLAYNRVLSQSEITQNFNAQKSRFGL